MNHLIDSVYISTAYSLGEGRLPMRVRTVSVDVYLHGYAIATLNSVGMVVKHFVSKLSFFKCL